MSSGHDKPAGPVASDPDHPAPDLRIADHLQDVVARFDAHHRHLYVNRAVERITGLPATQFLGKTNRELGMPPTLLEQWERALAQVFRSGRPSALQFDYPGPRGRHRMHSQLSPELDSSGAVRSVVSVARDLTELSSRRTVPLPRPLTTADFDTGTPFGQLSPAMAAEHCRAIIESSDDAIISKTLDGVVTSWNAGAERIFGFRADEMLGRPLTRIFPFDRMDEEVFILETLRNGGRVDHFETVRLRKDGSQVHLSVTISPIRSANGHIIGASKIARDITRAKQAEARLRQTSNVFTYANEAIAIVDAAGCIADVNDAFCRVTGYSRPEALALHHTRLCATQRSSTSLWRMRRSLARRGQYQGEIWGVRRDGTVFAMSLTVSAIRDDSGRLQSYVALFVDATEARQRADRLEHAAHHDPLTDLPNRLLLQDRLRVALAQNLRYGAPLVVLVLDLDGFKEINDRHGHGTGDALLVALGHRLRMQLREGDTLARVGGDEFVAVLVHLREADDGARLAERMRAACEEPLQAGGRVLQVSASIGLVEVPAHAGGDVETLLRRADQAMYQAKQGGRNRWCRFDAGQLGGGTAG